MKKHRFPKPFSVMLSAVLCLAGVPFGGISAQAADSVQQVNNIVLFAQFASADTDNFMADKTEDMVAMCNSTDTYRSLAKYMDTISYGKVHVTSYFPQMQDGVIQPYVLKQEKSGYTDYNQYALEMVQNITVSADTPLDGNQDGVIDNVTLVVDGQAEDMSDPLWAKAFHVNGLELNGTPVSSINLLSSYTLLSSTIFSGVGTLCHEFMHSMGYPDLYRKDTSTGNPVGQWDIMATNSIFLQYPLAYQRYAVSGWLDAETITKDGTYTLQPASSDSGNRLYLLKTPFSDTEFFAVEYRKPGKQYSDELDTKIYGEGMVVYRINTAVQGNYRGDTDGIYVFRPGETALNAGQGDLTRSCYGGTNAPDSIGTTDLTKTFQDGALVYSDGTNSGIALDDIQIQPDGTLTFSASFADVSDRQLWQSVCDVPTSQELQSYDMCTGSDGSVYLASASDSGTVLYRLDGDTLTPVSTAISGSVYNPKLAFAGNTPYLLYQDDQYFLRLCRWNGTAWETCYTGTELAQYADMTASGGKLYLTYTTGTFPYALQAACYDTATDTLSALGSTIAANACNMEIAVSGETVLIGYRDLNDNGVPKAAVWNGSSWNSTALSDQDCGMVSVLADGEDIWIAPSGGKADLYRWTDGAVISYPLPDTAKDRAFQLVPAAADGGFYLAVNAQSPGEFLLCELDKTAQTWTQAGNPIAQETVNQPVLAAADHTIYCLYTTSDWKTVFKKLTLSTAEQPVAGDINGDGKTDLADLLLLQRYLLGSGVLQADQAKAADIFPDGSVSGLDLARLRQMIVGA